MCYLFRYGCKTIIAWKSYCFYICYFCYKYKNICNILILYIILIIKNIFQNYIQNMASIPFLKTFCYLWYMSLSKVEWFKSHFLKYLKTRNFWTCDNDFLRKGVARRYLQVLYIDTFLGTAIFVAIPMHKLICLDTLHAVNNFF